MSETVMTGGLPSVPSDCASCAALRAKLAEAEGRAAAIVEGSACWEADYREAMALLREADRYVEDEPELSMRIDAFLARKETT